MDKNAIKKYAVWARTELITRVSQRAEKYDITAEADASASSVNGVLLSDAEIKQRKALIEQVKQKGFDQVMEEVAYTWFNRFIALRFMEVNGYLPSHIRVFTDDNNNFKPQILAEAIHLELDGLDMDKVYEMKNNNENDELYKYLIITQCNELSKILPGMFQKIADYTELLFPENLLREGSVIQKMIADIKENDWQVPENSHDNSIQIIGWLYQYYISEQHENVVKAVGKVAVSKNDVPAATQLFTPDWIVHYMVENSLGKMWMNNKKDSSLANKWKYYLPERTENQEFSQSDFSNLRPDEILCIDPCAGSGHVITYMFDVLMQIYEDYGISASDAVRNIIQKNLWGMDIDDRAAQLSYFSVMMKAVEYDRRFLRRKDMNGKSDIPQPHIYAIKESNSIEDNVYTYFVNNNPDLKYNLDRIVYALNDAKEYGSLISINDIDFEILESRLSEIANDINLFSDTAIEVIRPLIDCAKTLSQKYHVVVTNPPYLSRMDEKLKKFVNEKYKDYSGDLFAVFMVRNLEMCKKNGFAGFMTPNVWMFIKTYEKLRKHIIENKAISSLIQLAKGAFFSEAAVDIASFVIVNTNIKDFTGTYLRLEDINSDMWEQEKAVLRAAEDIHQKYVYFTPVKNFERIEASPIAYWCTEKMYEHFENAKKMSSIAPPRQGLATADNNRFLRLWYEVDINDIKFDISSCDEALESKGKWFPYNKGGAFRRWYGNRDYVVNWQNDGYEIKNFKDDKGKVRSRPQNLQFYFKPSITWSDITSGSFSGRYSNQGSIFDVQGSSSFPDENILFYLLGFMNSSVSQEVLKMLNPTLHTQVGDLSRLPIVIDAERKQKIDMLVKDCVNNARDDWNSTEKSWDYAQPLIKFKSGSLRTDYELLEKEQESRFQRQKENEIEINRLFIEIYGLESEMSPEIDDDNITLRKPDSKRDIKEFLSFAIGCMFGRYSLDRSGLVYAGGSWDESAYKRFLPDKDAIIPITDDEYFSDDVVGRLEEFLIALYGDQSLEDNLKFIAESLGGKGLARNVIREYFINDFFTDHCNMCSVTGSGKRPFYWMFDSGKKNGFKCLIYMHRYQSDTVARVRTDYVHEQQSRYRTAIEETENRLISASGSEKVKLDKKLKKLREQEIEIHNYEELIHHLADQMIDIDLDDGVKENYAKFQDVLAKIK